MKNKKDSHTTPITFEEILEAIENKSNRSIIIERLKESNPSDDEIIGVKDFLEENDYDFNALSDFLLDAELSIDSKLVQKPKNNKTWLKVAAVVIPLIGLSLFFTIQQFNTPEPRYAVYHYNELGLPVVLGSNENKVFNESMNHFRNNDFSKALTGFEQLESPKTNDTLIYFIGVCYFERQNYVKAETTLKKIKDSETYHNKAEYYLGLSYLYLDEKEKAKHTFEKIAQTDGHLLKKEAQLVLDQEFSLNR